MKDYESTEIAYKNGYAQGLKDAVKHGRWIDKGMDGDFSWRIDGRGSCWHVHECSACGGNLCVMLPSNFCPHCGAKMDLEG